MKKIVTGLFFSFWDEIADLNEKSVFSFYHPPHYSVPERLFSGLIEEFAHFCAEVFSTLIHISDWLKNRCRMYYDFNTFFFLSFVSRLAKLVTSTRLNKSVSMFCGFSYLSFVLPKAVLCYTRYH